MNKLRATLKRLDRGLEVGREDLGVKKVLQGDKPIREKYDSLHNEVKSRLKMLEVDQSTKSTLLDGKDSKGCF